MRLELPPDLVGRLQITDAVEREGHERMSYLPSRVIDSVFRDRTAEVSPLIEGRIAGALRVDPAEIVWVPKAGRVDTYRPVTALTPLSRVLLRALTADLHELVRSPDRSVSAFRDFQTSVLAVPNTTHVVVADVASFYFFVDHEMLEARAVEASARADTGSAIRAVLTSFYQRPFGLPQNFGPSSLLSELCIAPVERRLVRRGIPTFRSNDDFRLAAPTWGDALRYLEALQQEVSNVGLDLNAEKTWILKAETYRVNLGLKDQILEQALRDLAELEETEEMDPYTGEPVEGDESERTHAGRPAGRHSAQTFS